MDKKEKHFLLLLIVLAFFVRIVPAMLFIEFPNIPHDFSGVITYAHSFMNGTLYEPQLGYGVPSVYGPLFSMVMAGWILLGGESYYWLKVPYVLFDVVNVVLVYLLVKELAGDIRGRYASVIFAFGYIPLMGVTHGSNNMMFMTFLLLAVWFLVAARYTWSAIALGIGIGFKAVPLVALPAILWYVWQKKEWVLGYVATVFMAVFLILLPFFGSGFGVLFPYMPNGIMNIASGSGLLGLYNYLHYFFVIGVDKPYTDYVFPDWAATGFMVLGFALAGAYIWKVRWENKELELIRNIFLLTWAGLMFGKVFYSFYLYWMFPWVLVLMARCGKEKYDHTDMFVGGVLAVYSMIMTAGMYRWDVAYSVVEKLIFVLVIILAYMGTVLMLGRSRFAAPLGLLVFVAAAESQLHTYLLTLLGLDKKWAWGMEAVGVNVLMIVGMVWLAWVVCGKVYKRAE